MTYLLGMKNAKEKDKDKTHRVGRKNEYKTEGKKNTRKNGTVPVPEDKPRYYAGPAHGSGDK